VSHLGCDQEGILTGREGLRSGGAGASVVVAGCLYVVRVGGLGDLEVVICGFWPRESGDVSGAREEEGCGG